MGIITMVGVVSEPLDETSVNLLAKMIVREHFETRRNIDKIRHAYFLHDEKRWQQVKQRVDELLTKRGVYSA